MMWTARFQLRVLWDCLAFSLAILLYSGKPVQWGHKLWSNSVSRACSRYFHKSCSASLLEIWWYENMDFDRPCSCFGFLCSHRQSHDRFGWDKDSLPVYRPHHVPKVKRRQCWKRENNTWREMSSRVTSHLITKLVLLFFKKGPCFVFWLNPFSVLPYKSVGCIGGGKPNRVKELRQSSRASFLYIAFFVGSVGIPTNT